MKISVIMACFNAEKFLEKSILSLTNQSWEDFELIVVDDCSTDGSLKLLRKLSDLDSRLIVVENKINLGPAASRNLAIDCAKGDLIAVQDADDISLPNRLETQFNLFSNNSEIILCGADSYEIDTSDNQIRQNKYPVSDERLKRNLLQRKKFPSHSSIMYRKEKVIEVGMYNERFKLSQDFDLWLKLGNKGKFCSIAQPLVSYRRHENNISGYQSATNVAIHSTCAIVCEILRSKGESDPSSSKNDNEWKAFFSFIENNVSKSETLNIRSSLYKHRKINSLSTMIAYCFSIGYLVLYRLINLRANFSRKNAFATRYQKISRDWLQIKKHSDFNYPS